MKDIEVIARFNNGNGGASLVLKVREDAYIEPRPGVLESVEVIKEHGKFLNPAEAYELAAELAEKASPVTPEVANAISQLKLAADRARGGRLVLPVKEKP